MRLAFLAPLVAPLREAQLGGAHAFVSDLARALDARGHRVAVVCARGSQLRGVELIEIDVPDAVAAARVRPAGGSVAPAAGARPTFQAAYRRARGWGAELVSQHAFDAEAIEEAPTAGVPVVHTLHLLPVTSDSVLAAARASLDHLVSVSRYSSSAWAAAGVRTRVIVNGVPDVGLEAAGPPAGALVAGRVSPEKGTHRAIALARRAGLEPMVVGEVYDPDYARAHAISTGSIPRPELWRAMAGAAVTLMPVEWDEPFGMVAAEAMVAGCPVVAYARGALPEVVAGGRGGVLVAPGDEEAFVDGIHRARQLSRAGVRASAHPRLSIDRCAADYEALFTATLRGEGPVRRPFSAP